MDKAIKSVYEAVKARDPDQPEFHQAVEEVLDSLGPVISENPEYMDVVKGMVAVSYTHLTLPTKRIV